MSTEAQTIPEAKKPSASKVFKALDKQMALAEHIQAAHVHTPEYGTPYEALMEPAYWNNVASKLRPFSKIIIRTEDESYYAELLVKRASRTEAVVMELLYIDMTKSDAELTDPDPGFEVSWGGPAQQFRVVRKSDKAIISRDHGSKDDARRALDAYTKSLNH